MEPLVHFFSFGTLVLDAEGARYSTLCGLMVPEQQIALRTDDLTCLACVADCTDPEGQLLDDITPTALSRLPKQTCGPPAT
jgi:hypothetical protein